MLRDEKKISVKTLMPILSILLNIVYFVVLNLELYTDRSMMPTGDVREWQRSPVTRLGKSDRAFLFYLQIVFAAVSIITGVLQLFGVRNSIIKKVQLVSTAGATVLFVIIMIVTSDSYVNYA